MPIDIGLVDGLVKLAGLPTMLEVNEEMGKGQVAMAQAVSGVTSSIAGQIRNSVKISSEKAEAEARAARIKSYREILGLEANVALTKELIESAKELLAMA